MAESVRPACTSLKAATLLSTAAKVGPLKSIKSTCHQTRHHQLHDLLLSEEAAVVCAESMATAAVTC